MIQLSKQLCSVGQASLTSFDRDNWTGKTKKDRKGLISPLVMSASYLRRLWQPHYAFQKLVNVRNEKDYITNKGTFCDQFEGKPCDSIVADMILLHTWSIINDYDKNRVSQYDIGSLQIESSITEDYFRLAILECEKEPKNTNTAICDLIKESLPVVEQISEECRNVLMHTSIDNVHTKEDVIIELE